MYFFYDFSCPTLHSCDLDAFWVETFTGLSWVIHTDSVTVSTVAYQCSVTLESKQKISKRRNERGVIINTQHEKNEKSSIRKMNQCAKNVVKIKFEVQANWWKKTDSVKPKKEGEASCISLRSDGSLVICGEGCCLGVPIFCNERRKWREERAPLSSSDYMTQKEKLGWGWVSWRQTDRAGEDGSLVPGTVPWIPTLQSLIKHTISWHRMQGVLHLRKQTS